MDEALLEKLRKIRLFLLDVDGVLTDGGIFFSGDGLEAKRFDVRDGAGVKFLQKGGVEVGFLTGRSSEVVRRRAEDLGVSLVRQGALEKGEALKEIIASSHVQAAETAFMGDDLLDLPALRSVGFSACPCDAHQEVKRRVDFVCSMPGGAGAVREAAELLLQAQGKWQSILDHYSDGEKNAQAP